MAVETILSLKIKNNLLETKVQKLAVDKTILRDIVSQIKAKTNDKDIKKVCDLGLSKTNNK